MLKKISSFLIVAIMLMAILTPLTAMAAVSGQCGDNLSWTLDDSGTLTISGTGDMWDWMGDSSWIDCMSSIRKVMINSGVASIGDEAFSFCENLTTISIPSSVSSIGDEAFSYCGNLTSISIPASVISIEDFAFAGCEKLTTISIPSGVTRIGRRVFDGCDSLKSISIDENNPIYCDINGIVFSKDKTVVHIYPSGKKEKSYAIPEGASIIGYGAFSGCRNLTSISIPSSVTAIGYSAFYGCDSLTSITIPDSVRSIGDYAFCGCMNLTSISIPASVSSIGDGAFFCCENLTTISISGSVTSIGDEAFWGCESLTSICIPSSVTSIGVYAFSNCDSLASISISGSVTSIGDDAFSSCDSLADIYYGGSEEEWIALSESAAVPETITIHYHSSVIPGTIIGSALRTNITAAINGHAIPSFNVDGYTYIVAEDLKDYGFSVYYDNATRTLGLNRDASKTGVSRNYVKPYVAPGEVGIKEHDILATDIVSYLDNNYVASFNINGQTIIKFDELGRYGAVSFDNSTRIISVTIPGLN